MDSPWRSTPRRPLSIPLPQTSIQATFKMSSPFFPASAPAQDPAQERSRSRSVRPPGQILPRQLRRAEEMTGLNADRDTCQQSCRANLLHFCSLPQPASSAFQHRESIETANASLHAVMALACSSSYYKCVAMDKIQAMVAHGLNVNPEKEDYLTCKHHQKGGRYLLLQSATQLMAHFSAKHSHT